MRDAAARAADSMDAVSSFAVHIVDADLEPEPLDPASILEGTPETTGVVLFESGDGRVTRGLWQCTPGRVTDVEADEMFVVVSGRATHRVRGRRVDRCRAGRRVRSRGGCAHRVDGPRDAAQGLPDHLRAVSAYAGARLVPLLARPAGRAGAGPAADRRRDVRSGDRRRRLHRAVGRDPRQAGRSRPRRRAGGGRHRRLRWQRPQRRVRRRVADPWAAERPGALPRRDRRAGAAGTREPGGHRGDDGAVLDRRRLREDRLPGRRPRAARGGGAVRARGAAAGAGDRRGVPRPGGGAARARLADVHRRTVAAHGQRDHRSGAAGVGPGARGVRAGRADPRAQPGDVARRHAGRRRADRRRGPPARPPGGSGHQRLPAAGAGDPPLRGAGLRLRAGHRAALGGAAGGDRLGESPGHGRLHQPVPLLPADRGRPHPVGRLRRHLPLRQRGGAAAGGSRRDVLAAVRALLPDVPAAGGADLHAPLGRGDRHVQPVLRDVGDCPVRQGGLRGRLHRPGRGVDAVRRAGRARPGRRAGHRADAPAASSAPSRCPSRPSRCAGPASSSPAGRSTGPTATTGRRGLWLRSLDRVGLGFDLRADPRCEGNNGV